MAAGRKSLILFYSFREFCPGLAGFIAFGPTWQGRNIVAEGWREDSCSAHGSRKQRKWVRTDLGIRPTVGEHISNYPWPPAASTTIPQLCHLRTKA